MKRVICFICFLVVIFHAWNPGSLISSQEIPKEFVGIKAEFEKILETHTILPPRLTQKCQLIQAIMNTFNK